MFRFCSILLCCLVTLPALAGPDGVVHVIDGDTIDVGRGDDRVRVRLHGIDAPEGDQSCGGAGVPMWACGDWVTRTVRDRYEGQRARCDATGTDRYGRTIATCKVAGKDIGRSLVQTGLAFAYRQYSMDYDLDEKIAAVSDAGLHATGVQSPAAFRAAGRAGRAAVNDASAPPGCPIKGNISKHGHIYHMPGQGWYDATRISPDKGEGWFCSEDEARGAGWRRARR
ncbi:nuclease [Salipiger aestuarii]|uniref:Endonuclease YncB(Thermonuclease family) n=1 Tax=Salipiger aestuarii TaxID=568098 RepID=A0A327YCD7_9RHOB|nr:thermonuclease family protein [Salipiger aestuarii]KAB2541950.1 nuclease [Salipiger aestuarii]RAK18127.1 endonuclease YncB(thermonuclease family) [Salipiger aestuarii]